MNARTKNDLLRKIPAVDEVLRRPAVLALMPLSGRSLILRAVQDLLADKRKQILSVQDQQSCETDITVSQIQDKIIKLQRPSLQKVINATGIIVHTNLGRAPLSDDAVQAVINAARYYSNLEFDLGEARRGMRSAHVEPLLRKLSGAESGFVVNNNAAAVLLCLSTVAQGREVIISRGELIEIGGSFRIPDIMAQSGAILVEVGTTNRTTPDDYVRAVNDRTALIMKAHTSNYRIVGFTSEAGISDLSRLGKQFKIPVLFDMGSGNLMPNSAPGIQGELTVQEAVNSGADLITFSGDKLLGGPQAGVIVGSETYVHLLRKNPLSRALRIDKLTLAALESTLRAYLLQPDIQSAIPVPDMLGAPADSVRKKARRLLRIVEKHLPSLDIEVKPDVSQVGGGAFPLHDIPTWAVAINPAPSSVNDFERRLRMGSPPVVARIAQDRVICDMRTVFPDEVSTLAQCIVSAVTRQPR